MLKEEQNIVNINDIINHMQKKYKNINKNNYLEYLNNFINILQENNISFSYELYEYINMNTEILNKCINYLINSNELEDEYINKYANLIEYYYMCNSIKDENILVTNNIEDEINYSSTINCYKSIPILSKEEINSLYKEYKKTNNKEIKDKIILHNIRLIFPIANMYRNRVDSFEDLVYEGIEGIIKALENYNPEKGQFSTYATIWIRQRISRFVIDTERTIRIPVHMHEKIIKFFNDENELSQKLGRKPTNEELSKELNLTKEQIIKYKTLLFPAKSLNEKISEDGDNEFIDTIKDENAISPENELLKNQYPELKEAMEKLNEEQKLVIKARFGFYGNPMTLNQVSLLLYKKKLRNKVLKSESVRLIEKKALRLLNLELKHIQNRQNLLYEEKYSETFLNERIREIYYIMQNNDIKIANEIKRNIETSYLIDINEICRYNDADNYIKSLKNDYTKKEFIACNLYNTIKSIKEKIEINKVILANTNCKVLPLNIYDLYIANDSNYNKEVLNKIIDKLEPEERYILSKYYDIYHDTGELNSKCITTEDRLNLIQIIRKINHELPVVRNKVKKKRK